MSADITDLLASIDDVLEAVTVVPAPAAPDPVPAEPMVAADPAEAPVEREDRWDSPYDAPEAEEAGAETTEAPVSAPRVSRTPRLPYWWQPKQPEPPKQPELKKARKPDPKKAGAAEGKCAHAALLALRAEGDQGDGEVVARLCLDCDERLPATDPEPEAECEHEKRLEARSESGRLIGYVCAAEGCGARLSVEEIHGRVGKWLRPAARYYPRLRNPFSTTGADGEEVKPALSAGTLRLLANAGAAGAGYGLGLIPLLGDLIEECERTTSIGGALVLGGGVVLFVAHVWDRKTRHWHPITAWVARIPLASAITALALYAPASQI
ncbi:MULTISPECIES: hypothetical protein [unclassified Streptomyces]|uniref:hypothetical protein n=1 Tax=unclassified Streptomyces TaxID=2593676 RepID=UPI002251A2AD|nr:MULTISPECIES: hypothetical protein [unclassified Streptomyces]MCX4871083.1 hypothetical protein [Streptomyces sp. NBC_00906]MCX4902689.1 hypothetical protein [Streptomyces sp. NBC_00892]